MGKETGISWTGSTWNPIIGCSKVSPGCANCYAETLAMRWGWTPKPWLPQYAAENVILKPKRLDQPIRWRQGVKVFVNSTSDVFHEQVPEEYIDKMFAVMALAPQHTYQILTKRPERMREYMASKMETVGPVTMEYRQRRVWFAAQALVEEFTTRSENRLPQLRKAGLPVAWPLKNVWLGTSVENARWRSRIDDLRETPAAVRFLSCEPLLGPLVCTECKGWGYDVRADRKGEPEQVQCPGSDAHGCIGDINLKGIDWLIVGGESGHGARPMDETWARDLRDSCNRQDVAFWMKQFGEVWSRENLGHGGHADDLSDFPKDLRVQEFPAAEWRGTPEQGAFAL